MYDIKLEWNADLTVSATGDLALVSGSDQTDQRIIRRLLTNPGDYIWNLTYGGGLAGFVGSVAVPSSIESVIRAQLTLESSVPATPPPSITVQAADNPRGIITAQIQYATSDGASTINLNLTTE